MPFFSIILPTYNRAYFLPKAIESVLAQSFEDWELIIVDDGSTDNTREVVAKYNDPRIRYIYQENQERSAARNNGISLSKGEFICFLDSDDYFLPEKLSNYFKNIDGNKILFDGLIFEHGEKRTQAAIPIKSKELSQEEFLLLNPIGPLQVCITKDCLAKEKFNPKLRIGEDVELWIRLAKDSDFSPLESYQTVVQEHEDRSVNLKKYNSGLEQLEQLQLIFGATNSTQIRNAIRKKAKSNCQFNVAKHYMLNGKKGKALQWILKSLLSDFKNEQRKHRIYCLVNLLKGKIVEEYRGE